MSDGTFCVEVKRATSILFSPLGWRTTVTRRRRQNKEDSKSVFCVRKPKDLKLFARSAVKFRIQARYGTIICETLF